LYYLKLRLHNWNLYLELISELYLDNVITKKL
jgi:hypothetical protein